MKLTLLPILLLSCAIVCQAQTDSLFRNNQWYYCSQPHTDAVRDFWPIIYASIYTTDSSKSWTGQTFILPGEYNARRNRQYLRGDVSANTIRQPITTKDSLRHFHFLWSYNYKGINAWGENDIKLNHYPTKNEIIEKHAWVNREWPKSKIQVSIREVTDEELHQLYSDENLKALNKAAFSRAILKK